MPEQSLVVARDVPLAPFTTLGVGGVARALTTVTTPAQVRAAHAWCAAHGTELFVLGGGSNLVVADEGIDALVVRMELAGTVAEVRRDHVRLHAAAGVPWDEVVAGAVARDLGGIECLSGIPGRVGGTPIQNVGAYGQEVAETIETVEVFDRQTGAIERLPASACAFAYRTSRFKTTDRGRFIVLGVTFVLTPGAAVVRYPDLAAALARDGIGTPDVHDLRRAVLAVRRGKGMVLDASDPDTRSVGSFFMNPVVAGDVRARVAAVAGAEPPAFVLADGRAKVPAAWLIERAGISRGFADGAAGLSRKHPLALVNRGGATARDMLRLAIRIKRRVVDRFGIGLRPEPIFAGFPDGDPDVTYLQSEI